MNSEDIGRVQLIRETDRGNLAFKSPLHITNLKIWHCKYKSLVKVGECKELNELVIATLPDDNLAFLESLEKLQYLKILHMPRLRCLDPISKLENLEVLSLATLPSWDSSGKRTIVDSLAPISSLPKIKHLELFRVCPPDLTLRELEVSKSLVSVRASGYSKSELKRFYSNTGFGDDRVPEDSFF